MMGLRAVLLAAILTSVSAAAAAGEPGTDKPTTNPGEQEANSPAKEHKLDFKELFGCDPMREDGHLVSHEAAGRQETGKHRVVQAAGERDPAK